MARQSAAATRRRNINFSVNRVIKRNRQQTARAGRVIAKRMTKVIKDSIDTAYPPASRPGQPPHRRSGTLKGKTKVIWRDGKLIVQTTQVGIYLEGGTSHMDPRPHIRPAIHDERRFWEREMNKTLRSFDK